MFWCICFQAGIYYGFIYEEQWICIRWLEHALVISIGLAFRNLTSLTKLSDLWVSKFVHFQSAVLDITHWCAWHIWSFYVGVMTMVLIYHQVELKAHMFKIIFQMCSTPFSFQQPCIKMITYIVPKLFFAMKFSVTTILMHIYLSIKYF